MSQNNVSKTWATVKRGQVFTRLGSQPQEWIYYGGVVTQPHHCQLCDTAIVWRYPLTNTRTKAILYIGSECVKHYYEAYMPNGLERALAMLNECTESRKAEIRAEKLAEFKTQVFKAAADFTMPGFTFMTTIDSFTGEDVHSFLTDKTRYGSYGRLYQFRRDVIDQITGLPAKELVVASKYRASLGLKGYLSEEQVTELSPLVMTYVLWTKDRAIRAVQMTQRTVGGV